MYEEKHYIKNRYNSHALFRNIPVYEMNTIHCSANPATGYIGTEVTLVDDAAWNEKFSGWALTGATATGNNIIMNNDVTAQGLYETAKNVTLQTDGHGTISANTTSGFIGDQVTLSNTPNTNYALSAYTVTGATLTGNKFNFIGNDVTAKAWFYSTLTDYYYTDGNFTVKVKNATLDSECDQVRGVMPYTAQVPSTSNIRPAWAKYSVCRMITSGVPSRYGTLAHDGRYATYLAYSIDNFGMKYWPADTGGLERDTLFSNVKVAFVYSFDELKVRTYVNNTLKRTDNISKSSLTYNGVFVSISHNDGARSELADNKPYIHASNMTYKIFANSADAMAFARFDSNE